MTFHYGDTYAPYLKQEEPLKTECQHFLECILHGKEPLTSGKKGLELVRILEASSESLKLGGSPVGMDADASSPLVVYEDAPQPKSRSSKQEDPKWPVPVTRPQPARVIL